MHKGESVVLFSAGFGALNIGLKKGATVLTTQMPLHLALLKKIRGFLQPPEQRQFLLNDCLSTRDARSGASN